MREPIGYAGLAILGVVLYGGHLGDGYLADDFVYLSWLEEGWGELLRRVTVDSDPRMIRPLPALAWGLARLPGGGAWQHGLSLLAHLVCGGLVARVAERAGGSRRLGLLLAALFLSFPLLTEPVIWLSSAPDLWAAAFALGALDLGLRERPTRWALAGAALLFLLSLLSKESTVLLPLVALCFGPWRRNRRLAAVLGAVAAVYLAGRLAIFHGPGGYLDSQGRAQALAIDPLRFLRNVLLQLPYRVLVPMKRAGDLTPLLAAISSGFVLALAVVSRPWHRPAGAFLAVAALVLALVPVAAFFSIDPDHESSRLLYFPVAVFAVAVAGALGRPNASLCWAMLGLVGFWSLATLANGRSWNEGAREVRQTLAAMRSIEERFPADATVLVAGHDTRHGAYVWRNGLAFAARRAGLRGDLHWRLGTAALAGGPELGRTVFEIGVGEDGRPRDWTPCQRQLRTVSQSLAARGESADSHSGLLAQGGFTRFSAATGRPDTGPLWLALASPAAAVAVVIRPAASRREAVEGRLFWRWPGGVRFNVTESRRFRIFPGAGARSIVRLPAPSRPIDALGLHLEIADPPARDFRAEVEIIELPAVCLADEPPSDLSES